MAESIKKFLDYEGLKRYDGKIKDHITGQIAGLDANVSNSWQEDDKRIEISATEVDGLLTGLTVTGSGLASEAKLNETIGSVAYIQDKVDLFFKDADFKENAIDTLLEIQQYVTSDTGAFGELNGKVNGIDGRVTTLEGKVSTLEDKETALMAGLVDGDAKTIKAINNELDNLQEAVSNSLNNITAGSGISVNKENQGVVVEVDSTQFALVKDNSKINIKINGVKAGSGIDISTEVTGEDMLVTDSAVKAFVENKKYVTDVIYNGENTGTAYSTVIEITKNNDTSSQINVLHRRHEEGKTSENDIQPLGTGTALVTENFVKETVDALGLGDAANRDVVTFITETGENLPTESAVASFVQDKISDLSVYGKNIDEESFTNDANLATEKAIKAYLNSQYGDYGSVKSVVYSVDSTIKTYGDIVTYNVASTVTTESGESEKIPTNQAVASYVSSYVNSGVVAIGSSEIDALF